MAVNVGLLLKIKAQGEAAIGKLKTELKGVDNSAKKADAAMRGVDGKSLNSASQNASKLSQTIDEVKRRSDNVRNSMGSTGQEAQKLQSTSSSAWNSIKQSASSAGDTIKNKVSKSWDTFKQKSSSALDSVKQKMNGFSQQIKKARDELQKTTNSASNGFSVLKGAAGMLIGMIGYDLVNSFMTSAREAINAAGKFNGMAKGLGLSTAEASKLKGEVSKMQQEFRKVDMNAVAASALKMGRTLGLPKDNMSELTRMTAVMSSAFVSEGRTQEDAILAVADAMDGQFKRLQEIGITQKDLIANGFNGDLNDKKSLMDSLNKTLEKKGYTEMAKEINTLDEAWGVLSVSGGQLIADVLIPMTPYIINVIDGLTGIFSAVKSVISNPITPYLLGLAGGLGLVVFVASGGATALWGYITAMIAQKVATIQSTIAQWGLNAAFLANPITWIVIAIMALVVALVYLYNNNETVRNAINQLWSSLQQIGQIIYGYLLQAWNALVGAFNYVNQALSPLREALTLLYSAILKRLTIEWNKLVGALAPVRAAFAMIGEAITKAFGGETKNAGGILEQIGGVLSYVGSLISTYVIPVLMALGRIWFDAITIPLKIVYTVISQVFGFVVKFITILANLIAGNISAGEALGQIWGALKDMISGIIMGIIGIFVGFAQTVWTIIGSSLTGAWNSFIQFLSELPSMVWNGLLNVILMVVNFYVQFYTWAFKTGYNFVMTIISFIASLPGRIYTFLMFVIQKVIVWAVMMRAKAIATAISFVSNIINFIKTLPSKIWNLLLNVISKVISFASNILGKSKTAGTNVVNGFINQIKDLPNKVWQEMMRIGEKIVQAGSDFVNKGKEAAGKLKDSFLGALGIHSPGDLFRAIKGEMGYIGGALETGKDYLKSKAQSVAESIKSGFGKPELELGVQTVSNEASTVAANTAPVTNEVANQSPSMAFNPIPESSMATLTENAELTQLTVDKTSEGVIASFTNMSETVDRNLTNLVKKDKTSWNKMKTDVTSSLKSISSANASQWSKVNNNTTSTLNKITSSTKSSATQMNSAWNGMKNNIVSAANTIENNSTSHFNKLSGTIGTFYGKLQNPSRWGAGPVPTSGSSYTPRKSSNTSNIFSGINSLLNKTVTIPQAIATSCISGDCLDYTQRSRKYNLNVNDLLNSECLTCKLKTGGAGWTETSIPNIKKIKDTSNNWNMKGPVIAGKYPTGLSFKVKDFISGSPNIGFESFKAMAESVFSNISYLFYYNSDRWGSWQNAFAHGQMNCSDGTDALIALARTCGLPASKVHGHWGSVGHYWANIAGHKMDTTGFTLNKGWTPSESRAGPAPNINPFKEQVSLLTQIKNNGETAYGTPLIGSNNSVEVVLNLKTDDYKVTVDLDNVPENIDEKSIKQILESAISDNNVIKSLLKNSNLVEKIAEQFQIAFNKKKAAGGYV